MGDQCMYVKLPQGALRNGWRSRGGSMKSQDASIWRSPDPVAASYDNEHSGNVYTSVHSRSVRRSAERKRGEGAPIAAGLLRPVLPPRRRGRPLSPSPVASRAQPNGSTSSGEAPRRQKAKLCTPRFPGTEIIGRDFKRREKRRPLHQ